MINIAIDCDPAIGGSLVGVIPTIVLYDTNIFKCYPKGMAILKKP